MINKNFREINLNPQRYFGTNYNVLKQNQSNFCKNLVTLCSTGILNDVKWRDAEGNRISVFQTETN